MVKERIILDIFYQSTKNVLFIRKQWVKKWEYVYIYIYIYIYLIISGMDTHKEKRFGPVNLCASTNINKHDI